MKRMIVFIVIVMSVFSTVFATGIGITASVEGINASIEYYLSSGEPEDEDLIEIFRQEVDLNGQPVGNRLLIRTVQDGGAIFTDYLNGPGYIWDNGTKNFIFIGKITPWNYDPYFNPITETPSNMITITRIRNTPSAPPASTD